MIAENVLLAFMCVFGRKRILNWDLVSQKVQDRYTESQGLRDEMN